jgi:hypothetical protein
VDARLLKRLLIVLVLGLVGLAGWFGYQRWNAPSAPVPASDVALPKSETAGDNSDIITVDVRPTIDPNKGATPMAQRVAVVGLLNKRNGQTRDLTLKPGEAARVGGAVVRLRACEQTAPYEQDQLTGAFVQLDIEQLDKTWRRVFSGWTYKERPALNVVQHQVYDVWVKSCAMTFPSGGADAAEAGSAAAPSRSSAPKSPAGPATAVPETSTPDSAPLSNAR